MSSQRATAAKAARPAPPRVRVQPTPIKVAHASTSTSVDARAPAIPQSGGQSLPGTTRARMASFFGRSFDRVRVHVGGEAAEAARRRGAEALTHGEHICFAAGRYQPQTAEGERLLIHELTHVAQQDGGVAAGAGRESLSSPNEVGEVEAEANVRRFSSGLPARVTAGLTTRDRIMRRATGAFAVEPVATELQGPLDLVKSISSGSEAKLESSEVEASEVAASEAELEEEQEAEAEEEQEAEQEIESELETRLDTDLGPEAQIDEQLEVASSTPSPTTDLDEVADPEREQEPEGEMRSSTAEPTRTHRGTPALAPEREPGEPRSFGAASRLEFAPEVEPEHGFAGADEATAEAGTEIDEQVVEPLAEEEPAAAGACVINPRAEVEALVGRVQDSWDRGKTDLESTEAEPCSSLRNAETAEPHESGTFGTEEIPPTRALPTAPEQPARSQTADDELTRARNNVDRAIAPERPTESRAEPSSPEEDSEAASRRAELQRPLAQSLAERPTTTDSAPQVSEEPDAHRAHTRESLTDFQQAQAQKRTAAKQRSHQDFGERDLAPRRDPTLNHDQVEDSLRAPEFDAEALVSEEQLDRIPTDRNVGTPLTDLAPLAAADLDPQEQALRQQRDTRAEIDDQIEQNQAHLHRQCAQQTETREQLIDQVTDRVDSHRESLRTELDTHGDARQREAERISTDGSERATRIRDDAGRRAEQTMQAAETDAESRWRATDGEANRRADRAAEGSSLWDTIVSSLRAAVAAVLRPIQVFIDAARAAITAMLRAAAAVAHAIVEHARRSISTVISHVRTSLEVLANNLPGEFGEIARRWERRIDGALTEAQSRLDRWADRVHVLIDDGTDLLAGIVQSGLDRLVEAYEAVTGAVDALLTGNLMAFIRLRFPAIADLIDRGLTGPIRDATALVDSWVQGLLQRSGLLRLQTALDTIEQQHVCGEMAEELHDDLCEGFEELLGDVIDEFDELLDSPFAREIRAAIEEANREDLEQQSGLLSDLFAFGQETASTLLEWWDQIEGAVTSLYNTLGSYACAAWRHVAEFLGLPVDVDPLTALRQALERLWQRAIETVQPLIDRAVELWRWLREETFFADIVAMIEQVRAGWRAVVRLWNWLLAEGESWLGEMAETLQTAIVDPILSLFRTIGQFVNDAIDSLGAFVRGLLRKLDAALAYLGRLLGLESLVALITALLRPLRAVALLVFDCFMASLRGVAWMLSNVGRVLRTVADILVGIVLALMAPPLTLVTFFAGAVWVYIIPQCMKGPLIDFLLTILKRVVDFIPVPNNPILAAIHAGLDGVLTALLEAPTEQKVRAVDLIARVFAGDAEVGAGMVVGFLEAIWDSTIGLVINLIRALAWVFSWSLESVGLISDDEEESGTATAAEAGASEPAAGEQTEPDVVESFGGDEVEFDGPTREDVGPSGGEPEVEPSEGAAPQTEGFDPTRPPELPEEVTEIRDFLQAFVDSRITAEELQSFLTTMRDRLVSLIRETSGSAARRVLDGLNAEGTGYQIGHAMGYVYGLIVVLVVLAILTMGAGSAAVGTEMAASQAATTAARGAAAVAGRGASFASAMARAVNMLKSLATPLMRGLSALKNSRRLGPVISRLHRWFTQMLRWLQRLMDDARDVIRTARELYNRLPDWLRDDIRLWSQWQRAASRCAERAWDLLEIDLEDEMVSRGDLERRLSIIRFGMTDLVPRGTRLRFNVVTDPEHGRWFLEASISRSLFSRGGHFSQRLMSASQQRGPGYFAADQERDEWFSTAGAQLSTHERVVQRADELIEAALVRALSEGAYEPRDLHAGIRDEMDGIEDEASDGLLENVRIFIDEDRFEPIERDGVTQLIYHYVISPNTSEGTFQAVLPISKWNPLPVTPDPPDYGSPQPDSGFGTSMVASPLSKEGVAGTEPGGEENLWAIFRYRMSRQGGRTYYIRAHLLNQGLHGSGADWRNLSILTQDANRDHEQNVERDIKGLVRNGYVLKYEVVVRYGRTVNHALLAAIASDQTVDQGIRDKRRAIVEAEQYVPFEFLCRAWFLEPGGVLGPEIILNKRRIDNQIDQLRPASYMIQGMPRRELQSLNVRDPFPSGRNDPVEDRAIAIDAYRNLKHLGLRNLGPTVAARLVDRRHELNTWDDVRRVLGRGASVVGQWEAHPMIDLTGVTRWSPDY